MMVEQQEINSIWGKIWQESSTAGVKEIFKNRLFIEGYPVFKKYMPNNKRLDILDVGAGTGRYSLSFAIDYPDNNYTATDILPESLKLIENLIKKFDLKNVKTQAEDILNLSFPDNSFDIIFCDVVIQLLPQYDLAVKEMARVLKPGGRLILANANFWNFHTFYKWLLRIFGKKYIYGYEKSFTKKEMRKLIKSNNMEVIAEDGFYPAYGLYRLKYEYPKLAGLFSFLGKAINRLTKLLDIFTNRFFSRYFGIEIVVVGEKSKEKI